MVFIFIFFYITYPKIKMIASWKRNYLKALECLEQKHQLHITFLLQKLVVLLIYEVLLNSLYDSDEYLYN